MMMIVVVLGISQTSHVYTAFIFHYKKTGSKSSGSLDCFIIPKTSSFLSVSQSQNGFEELRLHVKEGGDVCKELSAILQER